MANAQVDETRRMNDQVMQSYKNLEQSRNELQESNNKLTEALQRSDARNLNLEDKFNKLRPYKKIIESSVTIKCKYCEESIKSSDFPKHMQECPPPESNPFDMQNQMPPVNVDILSTTLKTEIDQGYEY